MPRARNHGSLELAFTKRPALMLAGIVDRVERSAMVEHGNLLAVDIRCHSLTCGNIRHRGHTHKVRHLSSFTGPLTDRNSSRLYENRIQVAITAQGPRF